VAATICTILIAHFAAAYRDTGLIDTSDGSLVTDAGRCLYFSVITWTTLGYGDFRPTPAARPLAAIEAITGYLFMALSIGSAAQYLPMVTAKGEGR